MFAHLRKDNRGISTIAYMLILPLFILLIFGTLELWKIMAVRQSLYLGAYKAARKLSWYGPQWLSQGRPEAWEALATAEAHSIIAEELNRNALLPRGSSLHVQVSIEPDGRSAMEQLGWLFTLRAELVAPGLVTLLKSGPLVLTERQVSYIEGPTGNWKPWKELPEGWPY